MKPSPPCLEQELEPRDGHERAEDPTRSTTAFVVSKNCSRFGVESLIATTLSISTRRLGEVGADVDAVPCGQL